MRYVTASEMREIDKAAIESGVPARELMENAGRAVAAEAGKLIKTGNVAIFCGYGNNGGDGFVLARRLWNIKKTVAVFHFGIPKKATPDARLIQIQPWDVSIMKSIIKGIQEANLGLNPIPDGKVIRIPLPEMSRELRQEFVKT
ncbi:MAG: ribosome recycling factor, partial [Candidatus Omnitrophota bacterium]